MRMSEAPVILQGDVFRVAPTSDYETKAPSGAKVAILAGDGATEVKLDLRQLQLLSPVPGDRIAWHVRFGHYQVDSNAGLSCNFVAVADLGSVDALHTVVSGVAEPAGK